MLRWRTVDSRIYDPFKCQAQFHFLFLLQNGLNHVRKQNTNGINPQILVNQSQRNRNGATTACRLGISIYHLLTSIYSSDIQTPIIEIN